MAKTILYVHYVAGITGSGISLKSLMQNLDRNRYCPHLLQTAQEKGDYAIAVEALSIPVDHIPTSLVWGFPWISEANLRGQAWKSFKIDKNIQKYLEKLQPDIVHINDFPPVSVGITASKMGLPIVWHIRMNIPWRRPFLDPWPRLRNLMLENSKLVVAISEPEAKQFGDTSNVVIMYNPFDLERIRLARGKGRMVRQSLGISDDEYVVTAPVALLTSKGAWDFIEACGVAHKLPTKKKMRFLLVGDIPTAGRRHLLRKWTKVVGPEAEWLRAQRMARQLGIEQVLMITGFRKDIYEVMDASDLIVFPSHLGACGRPCVEAGALGKPIIVTLPDQTATRVVLNEVTGIIFPDKCPQILGEGIAALAADREKGDQLGKAGYEYVSREFDAKNYVEKMMQNYDRILDGD